MSKYLIEVPHAEEEIPCAIAIKKFLEIGSHILSNTEWGCRDGVHKGWILLEATSKDEARMVLPPAFRHEARITGLNYFTSKEIDALLESAALS